MRRYLGSLVVAATLALPAAALADDRRGFNFIAEASGAQVFRPSGAVDTDTSAVLRLNFARNFSSVRFRLRVFDGEVTTQAQLHCAPAGVVGKFFAVLFDVAPAGGPGGVDVDGLLARGTLTNDDLDKLVDSNNCQVATGNIASLFAAILDGRIYFSVRSEANPQGEVRGQIFAINLVDDEFDDFHH